MKLVEPSIAKQIKTWSDTDILIALQEARDRLEKPPVENFPKASMDQKGNVKIKFEKDISFPNYIKKEISEIDKAEAPARVLSRREKRDRRLGIFTAATFTPDFQDIKVSGTTAAVYDCSSNLLTCQTCLVLFYDYSLVAGDTDYYATCASLSATCQPFADECQYTCDYDIGTC